MLNVGATVTMSRRVELGGEHYRVEFAVRPPDRATLGEIARLGDDLQAHAEYWNSQRLAAHLAGWTGVAGADGKPLRCDAASLGQVYELMPALYNAAVEAVLLCIPRVMEEDRKNSAPSQAITTAREPVTATRAG